MEDTESSPEDDNKDQVNSLDENKSNQGDDSLETESDDSESESPSPSSESPNKKGRFDTLRQRLNIYLILLGGIVLMAIAIAFIAYKQNQPSPSSNSLKTQPLTQAALDQLANSDSTIGSSQYILNVESSAIFAGQVVIRQNLEIAGGLQVGGTLSTNNLSVAGTGQFGQATVNNNLTVGGNSSVQGSSTIAKSLQVSAGGTFGGPLSAPQITTNNLQVNGDLVLSHHITISGSTPSRTNGNALGSGGSVSLSGTDTAGSISINTGSSPSAGCFVTVSFSVHFNAIPHVIVTPIGSSAGGLSYYVNRSSINFSVCDASAPPSGASFGFDYFVVD